MKLAKLNELFAQSMRKKSVQKKILEDTQNWSEIPGDLEKQEDIEEYILTRAFEEDYPNWMLRLEKVGETYQDSLILFRAVSLENPEDLKKEKLGVYWTYDKSKAANYSGKNTKHRLHILKAEIPYSSINFDATLRKAVWRGYSLEESEKEFELKPGAKIKILSIDDQENQFMAKAFVNQKTGRVSKN